MSVVWVLGGIVVLMADKMWGYATATAMAVRLKPIHSQFRLAFVEI